MVAKRFLWDLGWGEPVVVRQVLNRKYNKLFWKANVLDMSYEEDSGNPELINAVREFIYENTGEKYEYVIITAGTNQAVNVLLRVFASSGYGKCYTNSLCFPYYPKLIERSGLQHIKMNDKADSSTIALLDLPSNPEGDLHQPKPLLRTIWDAVYFNQVYLNTKTKAPVHNVQCGSLSKVFGLTGLRIGWIATNDFSLYKQALEENTYETCTVSKPGQQIALDILNTVDYNNFSKEARERINMNRDELNKIKYLLNDKDVPINGMFYCGETDYKVTTLLEKADVRFITLNEFKNYTTIRFNLAQDNQITANAVKSILKTDKKK